MNRVLFNGISLARRIHLPATRISFRNSVSEEFAWYGELFASLDPLSARTPTRERRPNQHTGVRQDHRFHVVPAPQPT